MLMNNSTPVQSRHSIEMSPPHVHCNYEATPKKNTSKKRSQLIKQSSGIEAKKRPSTLKAAALPSPPPSLPPPFSLSPPAPHASPSPSPSHPFFSPQTIEQTSEPRGSSPAKTKSDSYRPYGPSCFYHPDPSTGPGMRR
ncbi:uncharacterized protein BP01DRAFT_134526 [Aspergillus saccharolyticus JOP 1030-1]|uniref:Uncharacterized protein n=1 Tax=Aspergillus saccharolyticus JOP 1030-1 TaxID=1450539 RepID=A0A318Z5H4_9EURO|nr:hypothetical protein BP01DRAFT_134526 [Aspergillus saccharolyticus JOP 1030-1]PYH42356.1 hypothetical protein BP01DRAFT_134526 [Aspergillus saccharolyticus JOP 1030-1]